MPSPFPGMDPYLEGTENWSSFHTAFAMEIVRQLGPKIRPRYLAWPEKRFVMDVLEDVTITRTSIIADVGLVEAFDEPRTYAGRAVLAAPLEMATVMQVPMPQISIEIRDAAARELVTAIEILSPTNKHRDGYKEYLAKRQRVLLSSAHLIEIDLLRTGQRVPMERALPPDPYFIFLSRAQRRPLTEVWPTTFKRPLPIIPVPLLDGDATCRLIFK